MTNVNEARATGVQEKAVCNVAYVARSSAFAWLFFFFF